MAKAEFDAAVKKWGNSIGVVIPAVLARRLDVKPGETVQVRLEYVPDRNRVDRLPKWDFVAEYDIDEIMEEESRR